MKSQLSLHKARLHTKHISQAKSAKSMSISSVAKTHTSGHLGYSKTRVVSILITRVLLTISTWLYYRFELPLFSCFSGYSPSGPSHLQKPHYSSFQTLFPLQKWSLWIFRIELLFSVFSKSLHFHPFTRIPQYRQHDNLQGQFDAACRFTRFQLAFCLSVLSQWEEG